MLGAAQTFFGNGEYNFAIARDARRGIVHLRIVDAQSYHVFILSSHAIRGMFNKGAQGAKSREKIQPWRASNLPS
ncbi:MAG: hypothetical protein ACRD41_11405 [Candidatus Acidiferrales bacterium]